MTGPLERQTVLWLSSSFGYDGDLMYFEPIFNAFCRELPGTRIPVVESFPVERYPDLPLVPVVGFVEVPLRPRRSAMDRRYGRHSVRLPTWRSIAWIARSRADVVIVIEFTPIAVLGMMIGKLIGARLLLLVESDPSFRAGRRGGLAAVVKRVLAGMASLVVTNNEAGERFLVNGLGVERSRVRVAPYLTSDPLRELRLGEDDARVPPAKDEGGLRRRDRCLNALFLNSVIDLKGIYETVEAMAALPAVMRDQCVLHVVGDGSALLPVQRRVADLDLDGSVEFYGRVPYAETARYYVGADVVVCPSLGDYRSLSGIEAILCGKPVIASVHDGAHMEVVEQGVNGWVVDPRNTAEFTAVLAQAIDQVDTLPRCGLESASRARRYTVDAVVANLVSGVHEAMR